MSSQECLMSGWLTKSPPEKKTQGPWKLFKAKWRKRYFVLNEVPAAQSLPGHRAALIYFDSETMKHKLGQIDLSSCDEVQQRLESSFYRHVFSLRTKHKGKDRTYYLVAENDSDMNKWVDCLCCVLGLKESDCEQKRDSVTMGLVSQSSASPGMTRTSQTDQSPGMGDTPLPTAPAQLSPSPPRERVMENNNDADLKGEQYIHLDECWTGNKRQELDAVPPPPVMPARNRQVNQPNYSIYSQHVAASTDQTYDKPRSYHLMSNTSHYDTRSRHDYYQDGIMEDNYDVPKSSRLGSTGDASKTITEDTYDIPRSLLEEAPSPTSHAPNSGTLGRSRHDADDRYINLPDNGQSYHQGADSAYDFPAIGRLAMNDPARDTALLNLTPPPPASHMPKSHKYVNAKTGIVPPPSASTVEQSTVKFAENTTTNHSQSQEPGRPKMDPQKQLLFSNNRTRSFKRNIISSNQPALPLPVRKEGGASEDSSSEDEDDSSDSAFITKAPESHVKYPPHVGSHTLPPKKSLNSTPPPPPTSALEVQYLDLDLGADKHGRKMSEQVVCAAPCKDQTLPSSSSTDYREIDFVKTKALGRMKQDVEKKRLSSEQSTDES